MTDSLSTIRHLIHPLDPHSICSTEIYRCPKGNVWELIEVNGHDRKLVRCTPDPVSGEPETVCSVEEFLAVNSHGPEHAALRILLTSAGSAQAGA